MTQRSSGILMPVFSLPSRFGIGGLGPNCSRFIDLLHQAGQRIWQILPLTPTDPTCGNSPYSSVSAFAGNLLLISPEQMIEDGFIQKVDLENQPDLPPDRVSYDQVAVHKRHLLGRGFEKFRQTKILSSEFEAFCQRHNFWLNDYARFVVIKQQSGNKPWLQWDPPLRDRDPGALDAFVAKFEWDIQRIKFNQFIFRRQRDRIKDESRQKGIQILGDIPLYVDLNSSDVWTHPHLFKLDQNKIPWVVAGVPPDYFSKTGQRWGNPVYNWEAMEADGFAWWIQRFDHCLQVYDLLRIDHFRGLEAFWEIPYKEKTAVNGNWVKAPGQKLLARVRERYPSLPLVAEDLGTITYEVRQMIEEFNLPGMKVLQFAFGEDNPKHPYLPHNYIPNCIVYTGTHDNNTTRGWFAENASPAEKKRLFQYFGRKVQGTHIASELMRLAMSSVAHTVILPIQDVLNLGSHARINVPAVARGNWQWRMKNFAGMKRCIKDLAEQTALYGRSS